MDTMDKTQRLNRTIPCASCGEMYSISYKRCPFCGGVTGKKAESVDYDTKRQTRETKKGKEIQTENTGGGTALLTELPEDFSPDIDWTPELDDGTSHTPAGRGGKRLQKKSGLSFGRIVIVLLSLVLIVAAAYIVVTKVVPIVQARWADRQQASQDQQDDLPNADGDGADADQNITTPVVVFRLMDTNLTLTQMGATKMMQAVYEGEGEMGKLKWESSAPEVVSVDNEGKIEALAPGEAVITAIRSDESRASCEVTCLWDESVVAANLSLNITDFTIGANEPSVTLKVIGTTVAVTWQVENPEVVTVSETGVVQHVGKGKTRVSATVGGQTLYCTVYGK